MDVISAFELSAFITTLGLTIYLFFRKPDNLARDLFAASLFMVSVSSLANFLEPVSAGPSQLFLQRISLALMMFAVFTIAHFSSVLANKNFPLMLYAVPAFMAAVAVLTGAFVVEGGATGSLRFAADFYLLALALWSGSLLYGTCREVRPGKLRKKMGLVALGVGLALLGIAMGAASRAFGQGLYLPKSIFFVVMGLLVFFAFTEGKNA